MDRLEPSDRSISTGLDALEERFKIVINLFVRKYREKPVFDEDVSCAMVYWRQLAARHRRGDYRHTASELQAMKDLAQWTVSMNQRLRNQGDKEIVWKSKGG